MPELPDVEGFRRIVVEHGSGQRIDRVAVTSATVLRDTTPDEIDRRLRGHRIVGVDRVGKWLVVITDGPLVVLHFGMTGSLRWAADDHDRERDDRVVFVLDLGELRYRDRRMLRGIWLADDREHAGRITGPLGPDALGISARLLGRCLSGRRGSLKSTLMDQSVLAGLGNMLSDEILWRAHLNPRRRAGSLDATELRRLHRALGGSALRPAVRAGRIPRSRTWLSSQREETRACCPRCGAVLRRQTIGGRTSIWCPQCQPAPS